MPEKETNDQEEILTRGLEAQRVPSCLAKDGVMLTQWKAFVSLNGLERRAGELGQVVGEPAEFLGRPLIAVAKGEGV